MLHDLKVKSLDNLSGDEPFWVMLGGGKHKHTYNISVVCAALDFSVEWLI